MRTLLAVLVGTGMRLDEALHFMWTDVDLQHRVIHVHRETGIERWWQHLEAWRERLNHAHEKLVAQALAVNANTVLEAATLP